jgi:transposase
MAKRTRFSPEVRERAVRLVQTHEKDHASQWAAICSVAEKIGCSAETLRHWVRRMERDEGRRPGLTTAEAQRVKELERENRELRRANEILRKASAFFAQGSSTAAGGNGGVHRPGTSDLRSRADLRGAADRSVDVLRAQGTRG